MSVWWLWWSLWKRPTSRVVERGCGGLSALSAVALVKREALLPCARNHLHVLGWIFGLAESLQPVHPPAACVRQVQSLIRRVHGKVVLMGWTGAVEPHSQQSINETTLHYISHYALYCRQHGRTLSAYFNELKAHCKVSELIGLIWLKISSSHIKIPFPTINLFHNPLINITKLLFFLSSCEQQLDKKHWQEPTVRDTSHILMVMAGHKCSPEVWLYQELKVGSVCQSLYYCSS